MATSLYPAPLMVSPTIINLHDLPKQDKPKPDFQSCPRSKPAFSQEFLRDSSLDDSDGADSDSTDGSSDATSLTGDSEGTSRTDDSDHDEDTTVTAPPAFDLRSMIFSGLCPSTPGALKTIPTMVLYDDRGLQLYDEITNLEEYYLFQEEIQILERDADKIADHIPDNSVVVELGAG
jgi:hypothetical protein